MSDSTWKGAQSWRGTIGIVKPTFRPGSVEDLIRILPEGIGVITLHIGFTSGTRKEFSESLRDYEEKVQQLAAAGAELVHPAGAPPFFLLGYRRESEMLAKWERNCG